MTLPERVTWEECIPEPGLLVKVIGTPACAHELNVHGIHPFMKGLEGYIDAINVPPYRAEDHHIRVVFFQQQFKHGYFSLEELEPLSGRKIDVTPRSSGPEGR